MLKIFKDNSGSGKKFKKVKCQFWPGKYFGNCPHLSRCHFNFFFRTHIGRHSRHSRHNYLRNVLKKKRSNLIKIVVDVERQSCVCLLLLQKLSDSRLLGNAKPIVTLIMKIINIADHHVSLLWLFLNESILSIILIREWCLSESWLTLICEIYARKLTRIVFFKSTFY